MAHADIVTSNIFQIEWICVSNYTALSIRSRSTVHPAHGHAIATTHYNTNPFQLIKHTLCNTLKSTLFISEPENYMASQSAIKTPQLDYSNNYVQYTYKNLKYIKHKMSALLFETLQCYNVLTQQV